MLKSIAICAAVMLALMSPAMAEDVLQSADAPATAAAAGEVPQAVKDACKDDFEKHCKKHEPESAAARDCMAGAFEKLSDPCVTAILDSPLADEPQQVANAPARKPDGAEGPNTSVTKTTTTSRKSHSAGTGHEVHAAKSTHNVRTVDVKPASRAPKAKHSVPAKYAAAKTKRHVAHSANGQRRSVAGYVRRGTGLANYYVAKYTRFALAKAFR